MRLTCPNCAAQYEVDDSVIPLEGRDVQCSHCGHGWYQYPADMASRLTPPDTAPDGDVDDADTATTEEADPQNADTQPDDAAETPPPPPSMPARERLDESVLGILREEAERETRARQDERRAALETQPELGIEAGPPRAAAPRTQYAALRESADHADDDETAHASGGAVTPRPVRPASRRHQLPDIEEINSSLRASSERRPGEAGSEALPAQTGTRRKGFRLGLALVLSLAAIAVGIYALAPDAAQAWPSAAPYLERYVEIVDAGRLWVDTTARDATEALTEVLAGQG